ncbi:MAG TPA: hypothetical protein P5081_11520 [Phycisphaerae bacterium]|nr:hypothetical protein [Phycisphaerae bacterium]HRW53509.1 hypothetical protein [Phycisphaerae bacterium]
MKTNPSDILELISRGDADPLTPDERVVVDRAIAADPGLARERDAYARLDTLLARFALLPASVDWEELSGDITAMIREEAAATQAQEDDDALIEAVSRPLPPVDWKAFHARVASAVREEAAQAERERTIRWPAIFSWVAPLAAAAMIAIVVWGPFSPSKDPGRGANPIHSPVAVVEVELDAPSAGGVVAIAFDETAPDEEPMDPNLIPGGTVIVNGGWPTMDTPTMESPTVIDVDSYYY